MYRLGGRKLEINIPPQQIYANSKGGLIIKGGVMSSEYSTVSVLGCRKALFGTMLAISRIALKEQVRKHSHSVGTVEPPLIDILYSGHLIIQDKMLWSRLNLHYA